MCYFITIGADAEFMQIQKCAGNGVAVSLNDNQFFAELMPKATTVINLNEGYCSCDLYYEDIGEGGVVNGFIKSLFKHCDYIYAYCHMYEGDIQDEKLFAKTTKANKPECLSSPIMEWLPEDTVVFIPRQFNWMSFSHAKTTK